MKKLIYQYYHKVNKQERTPHIIEVGYDYYELSKNSISKYAEKCDVEYRFLDQKMGNLPPFYGIFLPFTEKWCHEYDMVCFIDSDILATTHAKNVFDVASNDNVTANFMNTQPRWKGNPRFEWWADKGHINSGVVIFPRAVYDDLIKYVSNLEHRHNNRTVVETSLGNFDQAIVNTFVRSQNKYTTLADEYNYHLTRKKHEQRFDQSLIHYHRKNKSMMKTDINDARILK